MAVLNTMTQVGTPTVRISRTTVNAVDTAWNAGTLTFASLQTAVGGSGNGNIVVTGADGVVITTIASGDSGGTLAAKVALLEGVLFNVGTVGRAAAHTL